MKLDLSKVMDELHIKNQQEATEVEILEMIKEKMPGYDIRTWDLDQYRTPSEIAASITEEFISRISNPHKIIIAEEIQYIEEWYTEEQDLCLFILAIKK